MADTTPAYLRNALIYSVYVRAYGPHGTFADIEADLQRIAALGTDIIWFMPLHPIGKKNKKGSLGCPYSIADYRKINSEYGTLADFQRLCEKIHALGMQCMIDVVYNHTSWDSVLLAQHPQWFYHTPQGTLGNRAGAWDDIVDLDYSHKELWDYQVETLCFWAKQGVDGFRCDVASTVPVAFWRAAREAVAQVKPGAVWLAESVHAHFIRDLRAKGFSCASDGELYEAFDITYDYDIHPYFEACFSQGKVGEYLQAVIAQESNFPANALKLRFLENHDQKRAASFLTSPRAQAHWTAWMFFAKGTALLYNGQEALDANTPDLFEKDPVRWEQSDPVHCLHLARLAAVKKSPLIRDGIYTLETCGPQNSIAVAYYALGTQHLIGVFDLGQTEGSAPVNAPDGTYENLAGGPSVTVSGGCVQCGDTPAIFSVGTPVCGDANK